jgi:hypothetical protein
MLNIPSFHVSTKSQVKGGAEIHIRSRQDAASSGIFTIKIGVSFDPASDAYPVGSFQIKADLSDGLKAKFASTSVELINSYGKHNPTVYLTGRCKTDVETKSVGLRYWLMLANNMQEVSEGTPDIVGFAIHDNMGTRVAYGTGPVRKGDIVVVASGA